MTSPAYSFENASTWTRFWHQPLRAERLALVRIFIAVAILTDQIIQYLPHFADFYGPRGVAPAGLHDWWMLRQWRWTALFFWTDDLRVLSVVFGLWMAVTAGFLVGWHTRLMSVALWFLTMCWHTRNDVIGNYGDELLATSLFLLMLTPCGRALSLDAWRRRRKGGVTPPPHAAGVPPDDPALARPTVPAWGVRLLQLQLCTLYCFTGLAKLLGEDNFLVGTWWDGTSLHYVFNNYTRVRFAYAEYPLPIWVTAPMTYTSVWFETLFPLLVLWRRTRKWALWFGVLFHIGIYLMIEVGWFSFYTLALYPAWIADRFFERRSSRLWLCAASAKPQAGGA